ncbi:MAG: Rab family GTPase, partial [Candidatus Thorarchaeota archaeon]
GDTECGKTSFTQRYTTGNFPDPSFLRTTIGASFDTKKVTLADGNDCTISLWDFGGQLRFIDYMKSMIRGAHVGLLFFDVSKLQTLDNIEGYWIPAIEENSILKLSEGDGPRFILVGNKVDLINEDKFDMIQGEMGHFKETYGIEGHFLSAKTGVGIETLDTEFLERVQKYIPTEGTI